MTPVVIGDCTLYQGDCREVLTHIDIFDHCVTDPPYFRDVYLRMRKPDSSDGNRKHKIKNGDCLTAMKNGAIGQMDETIVQEVSLLIAQKLVRWAIVFSDAESTHIWRTHLTDFGLRYVRTGAWIKPDAMPQMTGDRPGVGFEPCTICHSANAMQWNGGGHHATWTHNTTRGAERPDHPCPKPLGLMIEIVRQFSDHGEIICDPFMGSGTTGVACARLGRRFIGIELDPRYFDIACERITRAYAQGELFPQCVQPESKTVDLFRRGGARMNQLDLINAATFATTIDDSEPRRRRFLVASADNSIRCAFGIWHCYPWYTVTNYFKDGERISMPTSISYKSMDEAVARAREFYASLDLPEEIHAPMLAAINAALDGMKI